ncbi:MAG: GTPase Der-like, partial [Trebouxia sp. A1-2]
MLTALFRSSSRRLVSPSFLKREFATTPGSRAKEELDDLFLPLVAVIGRPNVGKSALFNRLVGKREALVHNTPEGHVTRDYKEGLARLSDLRFKVADTSGLEPSAAPGTIQARAIALTSSVLNQSTLALFLVDAREGVLGQDADLAKWLRKTCSTRVLLAANKAERRGVEAALTDATRLGFGEPIAISAETGEGMTELYAALQPLLDEHESFHKQQAQEDKEGKERGVQLAIMGLPNVGKSTLANYLLGRERSMTGPEPGLTRDAVHGRLAWEGRDIHLVDTAGWMRRNRLHNFDESGGAVAEQTLQQGQRSMHMAAVVVLLVSAEDVRDRGAGVSKRELALASDVIKEGRALLIVANKLDACSEDERSAVMERIHGQFQASTSEVAALPLHGLSAKTGEGAQDLLPAAMQLYDTWNKRLTTSRLNNWREKLVMRHQGDGATGSALARIRYITQVKSRPPTFAVFVSGGLDFPDNARRFLIKSLQKDFEFEGVPIRAEIRYRKRKQSAGQSRRSPTAANQQPPAVQKRV